jgi:hypothetical protein
LRFTVEFLHFGSGAVNPRATHSMSYAENALAGAGIRLKKVLCASAGRRALQSTPPHSNFGILNHFLIEEIVVGNDAAHAAVIVH